MCAMCHHCDAGLTAAKDDNMKQDTVGYIGTRGTFGSCKFCGQKQEVQYVNWEGSSPDVTPMISPTTSLSSNDLSVSSCSDSSVEGNCYNRIQEQNLLDGRTEDHNHGSSMELQNSNVESSELFLSKFTRMENNILERNNHRELSNDRDDEILYTKNGKEAKDSIVQNSNVSEESGCMNLGELDLQIWEPPDPEDPQNDIDDNVGYDDDDDDYDEVSNGRWGEPISLGCSRNELCKSYSFKEAKQRMMEEVMNGKFNAIVSQLLKSVGVLSSAESGKSWVDIVTCLSWEAASLIKPAAINDNAMDPDGFVKVKCVATGSRNQSQIIKGLVFKKHAAHKHMPTKYKNPRLLLIRGMLGSSGLSSFDSMKQEEDYHKSVFDLIEMCHPNVILVEKTVSRDIQELILGKGMTLVLDMKLHRLQRVERCTGSPIMACNDISSKKVRHCDSIYFEKFVEELAGFGEGGKRPTKTLLFIEGCTTRLGCTILLKGTNSEELKRIKCVLRCAVALAYHLILETSFLLDQKAMFSTITEEVDTVPVHQSPDLVSVTGAPSINDSDTESGLSALDIPISNGFHVGRSDSIKVEMEPNSPLSYEPSNPAVFSGFSSLSSSLKKVITDIFPFSSSAPYQSLSAYFGFNGREQNGEIRKAISAPDSSVADENCTNDIKNSSDEENSVSGTQFQSFSMPSEYNVEMREDGDSMIDHANNTDGSHEVFNSQSILVLMSSRNSLRGTICTQSRFSHIMFYKNFDVPLGKFLLENLLNQITPCTTCRELPEAHFYYYAHRNKQLTIQVKRLPHDKCLFGQAAGKIWMWSRCSKCKSSDGVPTSTRRVLISSAARSLSFGKFLELSLKNYSSSNRKSSCGHFLDRDFLFFFGLGDMAAMFRYSAVTTFTVTMPPRKLKFGSFIKQEFLCTETENAYTKVLLLFMEVENCLKKIKDRFSGSTLNLGESLKELCDVKELLKEEKAFFEGNFKNVVAHNGSAGEAACKFLCLNRLTLELLIEACIWDRRLQSILSRDPSKGSNVAEKIVLEQFGSEGEVASIYKIDMLAEYNNVDVANANYKPDVTADTDGLMIKEVVIGISKEEIKDQGDACNAPHITSSNNDSIQSNVSDLCYSMQLSGDIPIATNSVNGDPTAEQKQIHEDASTQSSVPDLSCCKEWFWKSYPTVRQMGIKNLQKKFLPKFELISSYSKEYLPTANQLIAEGDSRLHIPLRTENLMVSDFDSELSSMIACALTLLNDFAMTEALCEDYQRDSGLPDKESDNFHGLSRCSTMTSFMSSTDSFDLDLVHSTSTISSDESHVYCAPENQSVEIPLGFSKSFGKERYLVICHYPNQFHELRNWCCLPEFDYIASLSRCRHWDAKGGKSKSFFAKTLDDRFIVKEIKKTEFDSFLEFAPLYFKHMRESFETGSQTCLAKILGIYQVTRRHTKSGKEVKHDLMVMENLTYNQKIIRQYDLKGALYARYNTTDDVGDVLLDQNFVNDMNSSPLYVSQKAKRLLQRAVWNDTTFLNSINVMDYSLLVGVDSERRELVCGIIDYIRQYTWDKQLETWMKTSLAPKNVLPTVISPKEYKKRFRKFMSTHFLSVPDHWCSIASTDPCKNCGGEDDD